MKLPGDYLDLISCLLLYFIGSVTSNQGRLQLSPNDETVEKYANATHVHTCYGEGVKWYNHKKQLVPNKGRVHIEDIKEGTVGSRLFFERLESSDEGEYTCKLAGDKASFTLKVIKSISFGTTQQVQKTNEFQNITLKCEVTGVPKPTVSWHFKGQSVVEGTKYKIVSSGLEIRNVTLEEVGDYQCKAYQTSLTNSDKKDMTITLKVNHKPVWINRPNNSDRDMFYGYLTGVVNLTCEALAEPEATFTWKRNNKPIKPSHYKGSILTEPHRSVLQLPILNTSYYGEYECQAHNEFGRIDRMIVLEKGEKPDMPSFIEVRQIGVHTAEIKVMSSDKDDGIIGFRVQYTIREPGKEADWTNYGFQDFNKTNDGIYTVTDLLENTPYDVKVASRNVAGLSDFSADYSLRTRLQDDSTSGATVHLATLAATISSLLVFATH